MGFAPPRRGGLLLFGRLPRIASAAADFIRGYFRSLPTGGRAAFDPSMRQAESSVPMKYVHAIALISVVAGRGTFERFSFVCMLVLQMDTACLVAAVGGQ